jgi:hypothetical protein
MNENKQKISDDFLFLPFFYVLPVLNAGFNNQ